MCCSSSKLIVIIEKLTFEKEQVIFEKELVQKENEALKDEVEKFQRERKILIEAANNSAHRMTYVSLQGSLLLSRMVLPFLIL